MTDIVFHFNASDRLMYVCRLLRKAVATNSQVVVTGSPDQLGELDAALWTFSPTDFVPHCDADAEPRLVKQSPVRLVTSLKGQPNADTLLNLGESIPEGFEQYGRVIEVVSLDETDKKQARERWKSYSDLGLNLIHHDAGGVSA